VAETLTEAVTLATDAANVSDSVLSEPEAEKVLWTDIGNTIEGAEIPLVDVESNSGDEEPETNRCGSCDNCKEVTVHRAIKISSGLCWTCRVEIDPELGRPVENEEVIDGRDAWMESPHREKFDRAFGVGDVVEET